MKRVALRWGFLLAGLLTLLAVLGYLAQSERRRLWALEQEQVALRARARALEAELWARKNPKEVLRQAKEAGFVPMAEGRWRR